LTQARPPAPEHIVDVVFENRHHSARWLLVVGLFGATGLHAALWLWAVSRGPSLADWSAEMATRIHTELSRQDVIEVATPTPPKPPEPPPPAPPPPESQARPKEVQARPPPPARAGNIIAQAPRSDEPVDLTGETFVVGKSETYAGGTTRSTGTNAVAVHASVVDANARPTLHPGAPDLSRPVSLDDEQWQCAWPREADAAEVDLQTVVLRVRVKADGSAGSVDVLQDPGLGFGAAARACALQTRFEPAPGPDGKPIASTSPPIRVRFTR
jgi:protein TonB